MSFVDPDSVLAISSGTPVTVSWLQTIADNQNLFANPPRARVYLSSNSSIPNATATQVPLNAEQWDTDGMHSLVSNLARLTVVTAGRYRIAGELVFEANGTGNRQVDLKINGSSGEIISAAREPAPDGSLFSILHVEGEAELSVSDYVEMYAYQSSGGALNAIGSAGRTTPFTWLSAQWIGV